MKKILKTIGISLIFLLPVIAFAYTYTFQGGTGTTTPSGILYGDNGATSALHTVSVGSGCTFISGTLSCSGGSATPGGLNTQVQYNNSGAFGGISGATTNGTIVSLTNPLLGGATLTTSSVNGVTLTTGGSTSNFLNANGAYSTPATTGTVTSVGVSTPSGTLTLGGTNPVTTSGTISADLNLGHTNTWSVLQNFNFSSTTGYASFASASSTIFNTGTSFIPNLGTAAGSFLAVNPNGQIIATSSPSGSGTVTGTGVSGQSTFWTGTSAIAGDTNYLWDNTNKLLTIGTSTALGAGTTIINAGTLSGSSANSNFLNIAGTLNSVNTAAPIGTKIAITSAGSSASFAQEAMNLSLNAGYTGTARTYGLLVTNSALGTAASSWSQGNFGINVTSGSGNTTGNNIAASGNAQSSSGLNLGGIFTAINSTDSPALNVGSVGEALGATTNIGGFFGLMSTAPTLGVSSALIADNGATGSDIFEARANGNQVVKIDGTGKVGIGTTTPNNTLDINGNSYISGTSFFGGAITATSTLTLSALATPAGTFLASDANGRIIATTTPSGSSTNAVSIPVQYATTGALPANTYVGGVLTEVGTGALSVDGNSPVIGNRILVKNEVAQTNNGIYSVTATGSGIAAYVLTRVSDYNSSSNVIPGEATYVISGTANADDWWALTTAAPITVGGGGSGSNLTYIETSGGAASVTSVGLSSPNSTLTVGSTPVTSSGTITADLNLGHTNTFTAIQNFNGNASSTGVSANYASFGSSATTTITSAGSIGVGSTTPSEKLTVVGGILGTENLPATTTSMTLNFSNFNQYDIQNGTSGLTLTLTGLLGGQAERVVVCNPGSTAGAVTWASSPAGRLLWPGGTAPTQTTVANKCDVYTFTMTQASSTNVSTVEALGGYVQNF